MDFFRLKTLKSHTNAHAIRDRPSLKDGERQFRPGSFQELQDNSNETQTNSNKAKNPSDNAEMMVHVDESFNFHTSRNSYFNFDLISLPGLTLPTETNDIPENFKKIIRVKASRPLGLLSRYTFGSCTYLWRLSTIASKGPFSFVHKSLCQLIMPFVWL